MKLRLTLATLLLLAGAAAHGESLLDTLKSGVQSATGVVSNIINKDDGQEGIPRRIAVLPAKGDGSEESLNDIRTAIHNSLSAKNFELQKPHEIDRNLKFIEQAIGGDCHALPPAELAKRLDVEGLIYVSVPSISKVYAAAYAHQSVTVKLAFFDASGKLIWEKTDNTIEREGGVSLSPLGMIATALGSAKVLTSGTQQALIDRLARQFAAVIPNPKGVRGKIKAPQIETALSNAADGPFKAGDEIKVYLKAEAGLVVSFDLGPSRRGNRMEEQGAGEYVGRYVVNNNDNAESLAVTLHIQRVRDKTATEWRVPGSIDLDTVAPAAVGQFQAKAASSTIRLSWAPPPGKAEALTYQIERADPQSGVFTPLVAVNINEYHDQNVLAGQSYHYRIQAIDSAKNKGPYSTDKALALKAGPTHIRGDITESVTWHAVGSPYILSGTTQLATNAVLTLEPGTSIQLEPQAVFTLGGQIIARGRADAPISLQMNDGKIIFNGSGSAVNALHFARIMGGQIEIGHAAVQFDDCTLTQMNTAIKAMNGSQVSLNRTLLSGNQTALAMVNGTLKLSNSTLRDNQLGLHITHAQNVEMIAPTFNGNATHIQTELPLVLSMPHFSDTDLAELETKLKGKIQIDWDALPADRNLLAKWRNILWQDIYQSFRDSNKDQARLGIQKLDARNDPGATELMQLLRVQEGHPITRPQGLASAYLALNSKGATHGQLWIQEIKLPWRSGIHQSESYLLSQAVSKFAHDYLAAVFPLADRTKLLLAGERVDPGKKITYSKLLHGSRDGLYYRYWVAQMVNRTAIERELLLAGAIKRDKMALTIAMINQSELSQAQQHLMKKFDEHGMPFVNLGQGEYGAALRTRARQQGAQIALEINYQAQSASTQLSANLKQFDANVQLSLYDLERGAVMSRFTANGRASDFRNKEGQEKALADALDQVMRDLVNTLWSAEERLRSKPAL